MIAHEPVYEQLTLSVRDDWLTVDGSVETLHEKGEIEALLLRLLRVCGVKNELRVRSASAPLGLASRGFETADEENQGFRFILELGCRTRVEQREHGGFRVYKLVTPHCKRRFNL